MTEIKFTQTNNQRAAGITKVRRAGRIIGKIEHDGTRGFRYWPNGAFPGNHFGSLELLKDSLCNDDSRRATAEQLQERICAAKVILNDAARTIAAGKQADRKGYFQFSVANEDDLIVARDILDRLKCVLESETTGSAGE